MKSFIKFGVGFALIFGLVACSNSGQESITPDYVGGTSQDGGEATGIPGENSGKGLSKSNRQVIKTAVAELSAANPSEVADSIAAIVESNMGRLDQNNLYTDADGFPIQAMLVVRIPSEKLNLVLDSLKELGSVQLLEVGSTDVTVSVRDIEARVQALETSVSRLLDLLNNSTTTSDLIEIESALSQRQAELDGLQSTLNYYRDAVSYATLTLNIYTEDAAPENPPDNFWEGLFAGWQGVLFFLTLFVIASGFVLPWLAIFGIPLGVLFWWLNRLKIAKATSKIK